MVTQPRQFSQTATTITDSAEIPSAGADLVQRRRVFWRRMTPSPTTCSSMVVVTDTTAGSAECELEFCPGARAVRDLNNPIYIAN